MIIGDNGANYWRQRPNFPPFRLNGNRLVIGDGKTWSRVLERVSR